MNPSATSEQILHCQYSAWYDKFKHVTPRTIVIRPLPQAFVDYLLEDGIRVPSDGYQWANADISDTSGRLRDLELDESDLDDPTVPFAALHTQIKDSIALLGGAVAPKLNWSSPKDATWIAATNDIKCVTPSDIYLLLKASSYITHDLTEAFNECADQPQDLDYELVLRQYFNINPALEFRCFVKNDQLVGVCQRDMNYYEYLDPLSEQLLDLIYNFFEDTLQRKFPDQAYVFDIYVPRPFHRVWLLDINPFAAKTDSLLYSWDELVAINPFADEFELDLRLVHKLDGTRGFASTEHSESKVPKDIVDASATGLGISDLIKSMRDMQSLQVSDSEDED